MEPQFTPQSVPHTKRYVIYAFSVAILAGLGWWLWTQFGSSAPSSPATDAEVADELSKIKDPAEEIPKVNPFEQENPIDNAYKNPFD